jgi:hypothetical protein
VAPSVAVPIEIRAGAARIGSVSVPHDGADGNKGDHDIAGAGFDPKGSRFHAIAFRRLSVPLVSEEVGQGHQEGNKATEDPSGDEALPRWLAMCNEQLQKRDDSELEQGERHTGDWKDGMKRRVQGHHALSDNGSPQSIRS